MRRDSRVEKKDASPHLRSMYFYHENMIINENNFENKCSTKAC